MFLTLVGISQIEWKLPSSYTFRIYSSLPSIALPQGQYLQGSPSYSCMESTTKAPIVVFRGKIWQNDLVTSFRPGQLEILLPLLHGKHVCARMATSAGKSLCLFLAPRAIGERALGIIISPLNALMDQQVYIHCNKLLKTVVNMMQIDMLILCRKVQTLSDVGVTAVHVDLHTSFEDVAAGKFRFGEQTFNSSTKK